MDIQKSDDRAVEFNGLILYSDYEDQKTLYKQMYRAIRIAVREKIDLSVAMNISRCVEYYKNGRRIVRWHYENGSVGYDKLYVYSYHDYANTLVSYKIDHEQRLADRGFRSVPMANIEKETEFVVARDRAMAENGLQVNPFMT